MKRKFTKYPSNYIRASETFSIEGIDFSCAWCEIKENPYWCNHTVRDITPSNNDSIYDVTVTIDHGGDYTTICLGVPVEELHIAFNNQNQFIDIHPISIDVIEAWSLGERGEHNQELADYYLEQYPQHHYQFRVVSSN